MVPRLAGWANAMWSAGRRSRRSSLWMSQYSMLALLKIGARPTWLNFLRNPAVTWPESRSKQAAPYMYVHPNETDCHNGVYRVRKVVSRHGRVVVYVPAAPTSQYGCAGEPSPYWMRYRNVGVSPSTRN